MSLPKPGGSFPGPEESTTKTDIPDPSVSTKTDPETIALTPAFSSELLSDFELEQLVSTQNAVACGVCVGADSFITKGQKKGWLSSSSSASGSCDVNTQPARTLDDVGEFGMTADEVLLINSEQIARASTGPHDISTPIATSRTINNSRSSQSNLGLLIHKEKLDQEVKRLKCLREYMILDSKPEPRFERITALASRIFNVEIALISLVDIGRQWFMSNRGLGETKATPRKDAFCHYTVGAEGDLFIVEDALQDIRFKDNPLVTGSPYIRFYAGAPLTCPEGYRLGSLCVIDDVARPGGLSIAEKQNLRELADMVIDEMVSRREDKKQLFETKSRYMACTAHDMLTPLTGMGLSLSLARESNNVREIHDLISSSQVCCEMISMIIHRSMSLFQSDKADPGIVGGMKNLSTSDTSETGSDSGDPQRPNIPLARVSLINVFHSRVRTIMDAYPKCVPLKVTIDSSLPEFVVSDEVVLYQSTLNYLTNACKICGKSSSKEDFIELRVGKKVTPATNSSWIQVECIDCGPGVAVEDYHQLFVPFSSINKSTLNGSGLGLYSVAAHTKSMGGKYGCRKRDDDKSGAVFWFTLPLIQYDEEKHASLDPEQDDASIRGFRSFSNRIGFDGPVNVPYESKGNDTDRSSSICSKKGSGGGSRSSSERLPRRKNALVIDDSVTVRKPISRALMKEDFDVDTAEDGLKGLEMMKRTPYDVVFCDFLMPVLDGIDCVKQFRRWEKTHRRGFTQFIIGISANASIADSQVGLDVGMNMFQKKPISLAHLKKLANSPEVIECRESKKNFRYQSSEGGSVASGSSGSVTKSGTGRIQAGCIDCSDQFKEADYATKTALVVDDMVSTAKLIRKAIEQRGWDVTMARDGSEALEKLKAKCYTVVLMDNQMPVMSGRDCISTFRDWETKNGRPRTKNIFLMTASGQVSDSDKMLFGGVLVKPVKLSYLHALLDSLCDDSEG